VILVTRLNGSRFYLNAELILVVESTPDTIITLTTNTKVVVREPAEKVVEQIIAYQRKIRSQTLIQQIDSGD